MSNENEEYPYGKIEFKTVFYMDKPIKYAIVPNGYIGFLEKDKDIYIFPAYQELEDFFIDKIKNRK